MVAGLCVGATVMAQPEAPPTVVRVGAVLKQDVQRRRSVTGHLEPARRSLLAAQEPGPIVLAPPEPGVNVSANQVLVKVDDALLAENRLGLKANVDQAAAIISVEQALLEIATRNLTRLESLLDQDSALLKEVEDKRSEVAGIKGRLSAAEAQHQASKSALKHMEQRLERTHIRAPFDAHTVRKLTELGQWVDAGDVVCELVEISKLKARLQVPQDIVKYLNTEQILHLTIDPVGQSLEVRTDRDDLVRIVPDGNPQARTFAVLVKLSNPDNVFLPGMSVTAQIPTGRFGTALTVPRDAVRMTPTGAVVYTNQDGRAALIPVSVQFGLDERFVVEGDLREGDQVVTEGNERLRPGVALKIINAVPTAVSQ